MHTTLHRLGWFDVNEPIEEYELKMRIGYRAVPNVIGFSLFTRPYEGKKSASFSIVENTLVKKSDYRWVEWLRDFQDRRDISSYLKMRWAFN